MDNTCFTLPELRDMLLMPNVTAETKALVISLAFEMGKVQGIREVRKAFMDAKSSEDRA